MLQPRARQAIHLRLTPMQLPEATLEKTDRASQNSEKPAIGPPSLNLRLCPGEPSEIVVQIRNLGTRRLELALQLEGDFPPEWCRIGTEGTDVPAGQQTEAVLYFQLAADFFEAHEAVQPGKRLKLNYQGQLHARTVEPETGEQQIESARFNLYVRPRSLYLDFLPAIYRDVDFVGRLLKIFEQSFEPTVHTLDTLWAHLDPLTAPRSLLPFLAHWVGWDLQPQLGLEQQRSLIRNALEIYRWRGTRRGLRFYLHLATGLPLDLHLSDEADKHIGITEFFSRGAVLNESRLGEDAILGGGRPFYFVVTLRPDTQHPIDEKFVRSVIEQEKPAFCTYDLYIEPRRIAYAPALPAAAH
ncbi:MAG: phage tail protein [Stenomitos rutilans HA7619-LM2]|nr:phage tail protein [Stenomitos rutilans HA7619-LM2]